MSSGQWFLFWLLLTFGQWIAYFKFREWRRSRTPEPKQSKAVDRVLYHLLTDRDLPWAAGESWERHGRAYIVSLTRQGLGELLHEYSVNDFKASYMLGFTVKEEEDRREIDRLTKQLQRRDETIKRQGERIDALREQLRAKPEPVTVTKEPTRPRDPLQAAWEEWGQCDKGIDELMRSKGWQRITEPVTAVEDSTQIVEPTPDYKSLKGDERKQTMMDLRDSGLSNAEIGELFGISAGCVKSTISVYRKQIQQEEQGPKSKIIALDFDSLKAANSR